MSTTTQYRDLNTENLKVGDEIVIAGSRYGVFQVEHTEVAKITKTTLTLANGSIYTVSYGSRWDVDGRVGKERKSKRNPFPSDYDRTRLYLPDDPHLANLIEGHRRQQERDELDTATKKAIKQADYRLTAESAEAAIEALQKWLEATAEERAEERAEQARWRAEEEARSAAIREAVL